MCIINNFNNFTGNKDWRNSIYIRYDLDLIKSSDKLDFIKCKKTATAMQYFECQLADNDIKLIEELIKNNTLKFKYINKSSNFFKQIARWSEANNYKLIIEDEWDNPIIKIKKQKVSEYIKQKITNTHYRKYLREIKNFTYTKSNKNNILDLWKDVLYIDFNSWKKQEESDMKNLDREDLQYIFYMLSKPSNTSLLVFYFDGEPVAYSLYLKEEKTDLWYAAKWGASNIGREKNAGINCFFKHLELETEQKDICIDTWSRRNFFYEKLAEDNIKRVHIKIKRK